MSDFYTVRYAYFKHDNFGKIWAINYKYLVKTFVLYCTILKLYFKIVLHNIIVVLGSESQKKKQKKQQKKTKSKYSLSDR